MANLKLVEKPSLYDTDFYAWIGEQATLLKQRKLTNLDFENLIEEIESMGKSERRALVSAYTLLMMHLLKWHYQPQFQGKSWRLTIKEQRKIIALLEKENPSLRAKALSHIADAYSDSADKAADETDLPLSTFPAICPYTAEQIRDLEFYPS